jgi:hypothetical protein
MTAIKQETVPGTSTFGDIMIILDRTFRSRIVAVALILIVM